MSPNANNSELVLWRGWWVLGLAAMPEESRDSEVSLAHIIGGFAKCHGLLCGPNWGLFCTSVTAINGH